MRLDQYEDKKKELEENLNTMLYTDFSVLIEKYANELKLSIRRVFPSKTMYAWQIETKHIPINFMLDLEKMELIFEVNAGTPTISMDLFPYNEVFEKNTFMSYLQMMIDMVNAGIYYGYKGEKE